MTRRGKRPKNFSFTPRTEEEYRIIEENLNLKEWDSFSEMARKSLKLMNEHLKQEIEA